MCPAILFFTPRVRDIVRGQVHASPSGLVGQSRRKWMAGGAGHGVNAGASAGQGSFYAGVEGGSGVRRRYALRLQSMSAAASLNPLAITPIMSPRLVVAGFCLVQRCHSTRRRRRGTSVETREFGHCATEPLGHEKTRTRPSDNLFRSAAHKEKRFFNTLRPYRFGLAHDWNRRETRFPSPPGPGRRPFASDSSRIGFSTSSAPPGPHTQFACLERASDTTKQTLPSEDAIPRVQRVTQEPSRADGSAAYPRVATRSHLLKIIRAETTMWSGLQVSNGPLQAIPRRGRWVALPPSTEARSRAACPLTIAGETAMHIPELLPACTRVTIPFLKKGGGTKFSSARESTHENLVVVRETVVLHKRLTAPFLARSSPPG
jgi:hypothetical protein